jgi:hypothetical protein
VAYMLELSDELIGIHDVFHVSALKKCLADESLKAPLEEIHVDDRLNFREVPIESFETKVKRLRRKKNPNSQSQMECKEGTRVYLGT